MEEGKYNRDINCLKDKDKTTRLGGLNRLISSAKTESDLLGLFTKVKFPLLDLLKDPADKCKELAVNLIDTFITTSSVPPEDLSLIIQCIHARLGQEVQQESCEEVRISLLKVVFQLIRIYSMFIHLEFSKLTDIVARAARDKFPAAKLLAGEISMNLCESCPKVANYARKLVDSFRPNLFHQQFKVRINSLDAVGQLVSLREAQNMVSDLYPDLKKVQLDRKSDVIQTLNTVLYKILSQLKEELRDNCEGKLAYLLLCSDSNCASLLTEVCSDRIGEHQGAKLLILSRFDTIVPFCLNDLQEWTLQDNYRSRAGQALLQVIEICGVEILIQIELILPVIFKAYSYDQAEYLARAVQAIGLCCDFNLLVSLFSKYCLAVNSLIEIVAALKLLENMLEILDQTQIEPGVILQLLTKMVESEEIQVLRQIHCILNLILNKFQARIDAFQVFYIVLGLDSSCISSEVQGTIANLALYGGLTVEELYQQNLEKCLPGLSRRYQHWTKSSTEVALFTKLVSRTLQMSEEVLKIVTFNCQPQIDEKVRTNMLQVVRHCVRDTKDAQVLIEHVITPTAAWNGSGVNLRIQSIQLLLWLIDQQFIDPACFKHNWSKVIPVLKTCASDEFSDLRIGALSVFGVIIQKCFSHIEQIDLWDLYTELLKRLDDSLDSIRILSCQSFCVFFDRLYEKGFKLGNYQYVVESLFTNLDDPNETVQKNVAEALRRVIKLNWTEFLDVAKEAEKKHRHPRAVTELIIVAQEAGKNNTQ